MVLGRAGRVERKEVSGERGEVWSGVDRVAVDNAARVGGVLGMCVLRAWVCGEVVRDGEHGALSGTSILRARDFGGAGVGG